MPSQRSKGSEEFNWVTCGRDEPQPGYLAALASEVVETESLPRELHLRLRVAAIEQEIEYLKQQAQFPPFSTFINSLGIEGVEVARAIPVTVRGDGDEFIASFFDAGISTGGYSPQQAISNLQGLIADLFAIHERSHDKLSPAMETQRAVLMESVCRISQKISPKK